MHDPTKRFSTRVDNYVKYRPGYPIEVIELIEGSCKTTTDVVIADVGSGTGIFSKSLLERGFTVMGVEPNREMRMAAERMLAGVENFKSISGRAEETELPDRSVDAITSAQAVHWFDLEKTQVEFKRILKTEGWLFILWNDRMTDTYPFLRCYEGLLQKYGTDYDQSVHRNIGKDEMVQLFGHDRFQMNTFKNEQHLDYDGLKGRLLSSSYTPEKSHPDYEPMIEELGELFDEYNQNQTVVFDYNTVVYYGRLTAC